LYSVFGNQFDEFPPLFAKSAAPSKTLNDFPQLLYTGFDCQRVLQVSAFQAPHVIERKTPRQTAFSSVQQLLLHLIPKLSRHLVLLVGRLGMKSRVAAGLDPLASCFV
jgi:hypothetical protein